MSKIKSIEIIDFQFDSPNKERIGVGLTISYKRGSSIRGTKNAIAITTDDGCRGEYVTNWGQVLQHEAKWTCSHHS